MQFSRCFWINSWDCLTASWGIKVKETPQESLWAPQGKARYKCNPKPNLPLSLEKENTKPPTATQRKPSLAIPLKFIWRLSLAPQIILHIQLVSSAYYFQIFNNAPHKICPVIIGAGFYTQNLFREFGPHENTKCKIGRRLMGGSVTAAAWCYTLKVTMC